MKCFTRFSVSNGKLQYMGISCHPLCPIHLSLSLFMNFFFCQKVKTKISLCYHMNTWWVCILNAAYNNAPSRLSKIKIILIKNREIIKNVDEKWGTASKWGAIKQTGIPPLRRDAWDTLSACTFTIQFYFQAIKGVQLTRARAPNREQS